MTFAAIGMCLLPFVIGAIVAIVSGSSGGYGSVSTPKQPDGEEYVSKDTKIPHYDGSLADKVDTRFTNIVKNPWEDIL